ncbi:sigma-70 family RNA polymerase sigma factor [Streptomyces griseorubiginosus]|uniref:sigma-70 family RNA polymerase sigma factor n=1 Tax=Streptomyces griseorubiginosus TaxID=67304 RepID=UPI0036E53567
MGVRRLARPRQARTPRNTGAEAGENATPRTTPATSGAAGCGAPAQWSKRRNRWTGPAGSRRAGSRRAGRRTPRRGRVLTVEADDLAKAASSAAHRDDLADVVRRVDLGTALAELTERQRQALTLRYVADLPVKDCAEVMETGIDNMKKILRTALQKLRESPRMDGYKTAQTAKEAHR